MYDVDFIGAGWSYPLGTDASGRVSLVTREREIEQSIRLILGTAIGERPMRPDFGCRIHDHVFGPANSATARSEEHTSELQSHVNLVCRLLLEKKKKKKPQINNDRL